MKTHAPAKKKPSPSEPLAENAPAQFASRPFGPGNERTGAHPNPALGHRFDGLSIFPGDGAARTVARKEAPPISVGASSPGGVVMTEKTDPPKEEPKTDQTPTTPTDAPETDAPEIVIHVGATAPAKDGTGIEPPKVVETTPTGVGATTEAGPPTTQGLTTSDVPKVGGPTPTLATGQSTDTTPTVSPDTTPTVSPDTTSGGIETATGAAGRVLTGAEKAQAQKEAADKRRQETQARLAEEARLRDEKKLQAAEVKRLRLENEAEAKRLKLEKEQQEREAREAYQSVSGEILRQVTTAANAAKAAGMQATMLDQMKKAHDDTAKMKGVKDWGLLKSKIELLEQEAANVTMAVEAKNLCASEKARVGNKLPKTRELAQEAKLPTTEIDTLNGEQNALWNATKGKADLAAWQTLTAKIAELDAACDRISSAGQEKIALQQTVTYSLDRCRNAEEKGSAAGIPLDELRRLKSDYQSLPKDAPPTDIRERMDKISAEAGLIIEGADAKKSHDSANAAVTQAVQTAMSEGATYGVSLTALNFAKTTYETFVGAKPVPWKNVFEKQLALEAQAKAVSAGVKQQTDAKAAYEKANDTVLAKYTKANTDGTAQTVNLGALSALKGQLDLLLTGVPPNWVSVKAKQDELLKEANDVINTAMLNKASGEGRLGRNGTNIVQDQTGGISGDSETTTVPDDAKPGKTKKMGEKAAVQETLDAITSGDPHPWAGKWGDFHGNGEGNLPVGNYREYYVRPPDGHGANGSRRIVKDTTSGRIYYSWTHYGSNGNPPFVLIG